MAFVVGIDPGVEGGLALLTDGGDLLEVEDMPLVQDASRKRVSAPLVAALLTRWRPGLVVIEDVGGRPGEGASRSFAFGRGGGVLEGTCAVLAFPVVPVAPSAWKRAMKVTADKNSSLRMARLLWPGVADRLARVRDEGRAEAALIGFHGRAQWQRAA